MSTTLYCLINIDTVNYKIALKIEGDQAAGNFDDLLRAIVMDSDEDLKKYDFASEFLIYEIFDKSLNEYVRIDDETEIEDMSKIRVKILDPDTIGKELEVPRHVVNEEDLPFVEIEEYKSDVELVEMYAQAHLPDPELIKKIDNSNVTEQAFKVANIRVKKHLVRSVIKYQGLFKTSAFYDQHWELIVQDLRANIGDRVRNLTRSRPHLGYVNITPRTVEKEFTTLIGQYNRLLRLCQCLTAQEADRLWPFFKMFHKTVRIDFIYKERGPSLKIMQKEFDNAKKTIGVK